MLQFSVKHEKQEGSFCGGGYIKLLGSDLDQKNFGGDSPYKIMFGPDICGYDVSRVHVIFTFQGENLLRTEDIKLSYDDKNKLTHLYTLVVSDETGLPPLFVPEQTPLAQNQLATPVTQQSYAFHGLVFPAHQSLHGGGGGANGVSAGGGGESDASPTVMAILWPFVQWPGTVQMK